MTDRAALRFMTVLALPLGLAALALAALGAGLSPSFIDPDESAHYVNALFVGDWLRSGLAAPIPFAKDFYAHFPKLSIGHWPPGWYALLSPGFAVVRPSPLGATVLGAVVAGLPAALAAWLVVRAGASRLAGVAAAAWTLALPLTLANARFFLLDQPVAIVAGGAAIAWFAAARRPSWRGYALFGALAALATLVKGNGAFVMLVPALDVVLASRWRLLRDPRLWIVGAATVLVVLPWYLVSFRIAAAGFNYAPGLAYALASLATDARAIVGSLGIGGVVLAVVGAAAGWRGRAGEPVRLAIAVIAATLIFQAAVPVALEDRYVLPALPWIVGLAVIGVARLITPVSGMPAIWPRMAAVALVVAALVQPALDGAALAPKPDLGAPDLAARIVAAPGIWLVDGRAGGEGAVIAAAAYADRGRRGVWIARASQWLSSSDFMGRGYRLTARTPGEVRAVLDRLGVRGVVLVADRGRLAYPHSALLSAAIRGGGYTVRRTPFATGPGWTIVATRIAAVPGRPELLAAGSGSRDVAALTGAH